ncbi:MAG TPA: hypothetical protein VHN74_11835 [Candidatus Angelobacter sp.]|jgi:hypothetical protein|nr:hypothetical protein [Candidatus Angelobacter sp.]
MPYRRATLLILLVLVSSALAATRQHSIVLGRWRTVSVTTDGGKGAEVRIRELLIDDKLREYTAGPLHEVTDRVFVLRRAQRLNDALPGETHQARWAWRLAGWISVDRQTGHISQLNLPMFDPETSEASWYRDYAAYCGSSDDGNKAYLMVYQLGKRKPVLKREFGGSGCAAPKWERGPSRVTFISEKGEKTTFQVHSRGAEQQTETGDEESQ